MSVNKLSKETAGCMSWAFCSKYKWKDKKHLKRNKNAKSWSLRVILSQLSNAKLTNLHLTKWRRLSLSSIYLSGFFSQLMYQCKVDLNKPTEKHFRNNVLDSFLCKMSGIWKCLIFRSFWFRRAMIHVRLGWSV